MERYNKGNGKGILWHMLDKGKRIIRLETENPRENCFHSLSPLMSMKWERLLNDIV